MPWSGWLTGFGRSWRWRLDLSSASVPLVALLLLLPVPDLSIGFLSIDLSLPLPPVIFLTSLTVVHGLPQAARIRSGVDIVILLEAVWG